MKFYSLKRIVFFLFFICLVFICLFFIFYTGWNLASPEKTCKNCHEINPSLTSWQMSSHRNISCKSCHGTALSNGIHSMKEKFRMVQIHFTGKSGDEAIYLNEDQALETMDRCAKCHQDEYARWMEGGHSARYSDIFLNEKHNRTEQLNSDCLRCHGMFYSNPIDSLVTPLLVAGPWELKDRSMSEKPSIPCMACHQIHSEGASSKRPLYSVPDSIFYQRNKKSSTLGFYSRHEKFHFSVEMLPEPVIINREDTVMLSSDKVYRICVQCHAPSVWRQAGSHDDRTPTGVHEGISCRSCHETHSNDASGSCDKCHPAISNCKKDVKTMNTTYLSPSSPNNIHFVSCRNCHLNR